MPTLPTNSVIFWDGTHSSIPSGFSRFTAIDDGLYLVTGDEGFTGPASIGGTHEHGQVHTHAGNAHYHTFSAASATPPYTVNRDRVGGAIICNLTHGHNSQTSNDAAIEYQNNSDDTSSTETDPPHVEIIGLTPDDGNQTIPDDALVFSSEGVLSGYAVTAYDDRYLKGAATSGDGGTTGGSGTHAHTLTHTHGILNHEHDYKTCGASASTSLTGLGLDACKLIHHQIRLEAKSLSDLSSDGATIDAATFDPAHIKALLLQNTSGDSKNPECGVIVGYIGAISTLPDEWEVWAESFGKMLKITDSAGEHGDTGGNDFHIHNRQGHGHTHSGTHDHLANSLLQTTPNSSSAGTFARPSTTKDHNHTWTIGPTTPTLQNAAAGDVDSADGRPSAKTILWIRYRGAPMLQFRGQTRISGKTAGAGLN